MKSFLPQSPVAYFVAEYALSSAAPTYAGGLGVLAGDYLLEAAKENFPFILFSLRYRGYDAAKDGYEIVAGKEGKQIVISVPIEKRDVKVIAWVKNFGASAAAILIDPDIAENSAEDRLIADVLYDSHLYIRVREQCVLAAGVEFLSKLDIVPKIYHLNEGHTSLVALSIIADEMKRGLSFDQAVFTARQKTVFSKHTILADAGVYISSKDFFGFMERFCVLHMIDPKKIFELGKFEKDQDMFSTTKFGIQMSVRKNAVSALHLAKEKELYPSTDFVFVTNGIFKDRWRGGLKSSARQSLLQFVSEKTSVVLDPKALTLVWARRFAAYKRPSLIFSDLSRLKKILFDEKHPVQIIVSGKAHPADEEGQKVVEMIRSLSLGELKGKLAYISDYSLDIASKLTSGADLWVNTPERGKEACGTSGMKAGLCGALMCSISDGWMDEVSWAGAGWILSENKTAESFYDFLEREIIPEFYDAKETWLGRMEKTASIIETGFGAERMLADYRKKMYLF